MGILAKKENLGLVGWKQGKRWVLEKFLQINSNIAKSSINRQIFPWIESEYKKKYGHNMKEYDINEYVCI